MSQTNRDWLQQDTYTLALSSGFFGFYAHSGMLAALLEQDCAPAKLTGSSAGAIVSAMHASGLAIKDLKENLFSLRRQDFWDPAPGFGLLKGHKMAKKLSEFLPAEFSQLKNPLSVSAFDLTRMKTLLIGEGMDVITAVRASCALPGLFHPVRHSGKVLIDGGVADDLAIQSTSGDERVLSHYLQDKDEPNRFERWQLKQATGRPKLRMLKLTNRVFVGPHKLESGPEGFAEAYSKTKEWLNSPS